MVRLTFAPSTGTEPSVTSPEIVASLPLGTVPFVERETNNFFSGAVQFWVSGGLLSADWQLLESAQTLVDEPEEQSDQLVHDHPGAHGSGEGLGCMDTVAKGVDMDVDTALKGVGVVVLLWCPAQSGWQLEQAIPVQLLGQDKFAPSGHILKESPHNRFSHLSEGCPMPELLLSKAF